MEATCMLSYCVGLRLELLVLLYNIAHLQQMPPNPRVNLKVKFTLHIPDQVKGDVSKKEGKSLDSYELYIV